MSCLGYGKGICASLSVLYHLYMDAKILRAKRSDTELNNGVIKLQVAKPIISVYINVTPDGRTDGRTSYAGNTRTGKTRVVAYQDAGLKSFSGRAVNVVVTVRQMSFVVVKRIVQL